VRLASVNLLHGLSLDDGRVEAGRLRAAARSLAADVLGLQEVDRGQPRSHRLDLTAEVAAATGAVAWRFEPAIIGTPGGRWRPAVDGDGGACAAGPTDRTGAGAAGGAGATDGADAADGAVQAYGVGLVSRLPVRRWVTVRLPAAPVRSPVPVPGARRRMLWLPDEPRVALGAVVDTGAARFTVVTTHLSFVPGWNARQLRRLVRALRRQPEPLPTPILLLGDLNLPGRLPALLSGWRPLAPEVRTYPAPQPRWQLDHLLAHGPAPTVTAARAEQLPVSDHRALVVDLEVPARPPG
jgi:endonuclease/exonuclease/phosphatase family metal-dependent hydrolase